MKTNSSASVVLLFLSLFFSAAYSQPAPRPEHPRPGMMRVDWQTLNGKWEFAFDDGDRGLAERWYTGEKSFLRVINVLMPLNPS